MTFESNQPAALKDLGTYPTWIQDLVTDCQAAKQQVLQHEMWARMASATIDPVTNRHFMVAIWPFIERFPAYMASSLRKTQFGRSEGDNLARRWLVRNIRVEQNHAEYWLNWATGTGVDEMDVLNGVAPNGTEVLPNWCEEVTQHDSLAAGMIATNYAIEGVTGDWASIVHSSEIYRNSIPEAGRKTTLSWLRLHAAYDDDHPWEALQIVAALMGNSPSVTEVAHLKECVERSYTAMRVVGDLCLSARWQPKSMVKAAAA